MEPLDPRLNAYRPDLAAESLRGRAVASRYVAGDRRQVSRGSLPLHSRPETSAGIGSEIIFGEPVRVFEDKAGWAWLQNETDEYVGYAESSGLHKTVNPTTHRVTALRTYLYPEPDLKTPPLDLLSMNSRISVAGIEGKYSQLAGGGWVWSAHLAKMDSFETDIGAVALRFLGTPYKWGGRTSLGLDCSGLVQMALESCGKPAPRDSDMQAKTVGTPVAFDGDYSVLRYGDVVTWPGHCGLWLDEDRFVHANATDMMVSVSPLADVARYIERIEGHRISAVRRP